MDYKKKNLITLFLILTLSITTYYFAKNSMAKQDNNHKEEQIEH